MTSEATKTELPASSPAPTPRTLSPLFRRAAFLLAAALATFVVYHRSLDRFFAADQLRYFTEVGNDTSLSAGLRCWDHTATRKYWKGDDQLFRPVTYLVLAVENSLFGYRYRAWNGASLGLHLAVVFALFELLWTLRPSPFAAAFALLFSVLTANFEMVAWNHLGGYLLGYALILVSLRAAWLLSRGEGTTGTRVVYALAMTGAMGCHEIAVVGSLLIAAFVVWSRRRQGAAIPRTDVAALLLPVGIYAILYAGHILRCERWSWIDPRAPNPVPLPARMILTLGSWALRALDPWYADYVLKHCDRFDWAKNIGGPAFVAGTAAIVLLLAGLAFCFRRAPTREARTRSGRFAALLAALLLSYSAMVNFGRAYALGVTYYVYLVALLALVAVYALLDVDRLSPPAVKAALGLLAVLGVLHGVRTASVSRALDALNAPTLEYFDTLDRFVELHRGEPGFTFAVRAPEALDPPSDVWRGYPDHPSDGSATVSMLLYPKFFDPSLLERGPNPARHQYLLQWNPDGRRPAPR